MKCIKLILILCFSSLLHAQVNDAIEAQTIPISKTSFQLMTQKGVKTVDLHGENFIVVSVREVGSDGRFYAVDKDGTVWLSGSVTSGAKEFRSPCGIFTIFQKKRFHMSTLYPEENGVNNMDYMMKFTHSGHALHQGSVDWMSHGCIHIDPQDVTALFRWANFKTKVVITRESYMPFAQDDLRRIYTHVHKN